MRATVFLHQCEALAVNVLELLIELRRGFHFTYHVEVVEPTNYLEVEPVRKVRFSAWWLILIVAA